MDIPESLILPLMNVDVPNVELDDSLVVARELFGNTETDYLIVLEEGRFYGVVKRESYNLAISPYLDTVAELERDKTTLKKKMHQVMDRNVPTVSPNEDASQVQRRILRQGLKEVAVLGDKGSYLGLIGQGELLNYLGSHQNESGD